MAPKKADTGRERLIQQIESLDLKALKAVREQYRKASAYWICSNMPEREVSKNRRSFAATWSEELGRLYRVIYPNGRRDHAADDWLREHEWDEMLKDYDWMEKDRQNTGKTPEELARYSRFRKQELMEEKDIPEYSVEVRSQYVEPNSLDDPGINEKQREGLRKFHKWLYRHCEDSGFELFGSLGDRRRYVEEFMKKPARVQLEALYLIESKKRRNPSQNGLDALESVDYVPDLDKLKDRMVATKWKFWKRTDGSHLYWNKLKESVRIAEKSQKDLEAFEKSEANYRKECLKEADQTGIQDHRQYLKDIHYEETKKARAAKYLLKPEQADPAADHDAELMARQAKNDLEALGVKRVRSEAQWKEQMESIHQKLDEAREAYKPKPKEWSLEDPYKKKIQDGLGTISNTNKKYAMVENAVSSGINFGTKDKSSATKWISNQLGVKPDHYEIYDKSTSAALKGITAFERGASLLMNIKDGWTQKGVRRKTENTEKLLAIGSDAAILTSTGLDCVEKMGKYTKFTKDVLSPALGLAAGGFDTIKSGCQVASSIRGNTHANRVLETVQNGKLNEKDAKDLARQANLAKKLNTIKVKDASIGFVRGSSAMIGSLAALNLVLPGVGQFSLLAAPAVLLGDMYFTNKLRQEKYRAVIDSELFDEGKQLENKDKELVSNLERRQKMFRPDSKEFARLKEMKSSKSREQRNDILRGEKATFEKGCLNLSDCCEEQMKVIEKNIYSHLFYIDPSRGLHADNLITRDNRKQYYKTDFKGLSEEEQRQMQTRLAYKELNKAFRVKNRFAKKENGPDSDKELEEAVKKQMGKMEKQAAKL